MVLYYIVLIHCLGHKLQVLLLFLWFVFGLCLVCVCVVFVFVVGMVEWRRKGKPQGWLVSCSSCSFPLAADAWHDGVIILLIAHLGQHIYDY